MTIKIELEFQTIQDATHALLSLGLKRPDFEVRLVPQSEQPEAQAVQQPVVATPVAEVQPAAEGLLAAPAPRRGPGRPKVVKDSVAPVPAPTVGSSPTPVATPVAPDPVATEPEAKGGLVELFNTKGAAKAQALLARFGVVRFGELKPEAYGEFLRDAKRAVSGEWDPEAGSE
jgi:hypothetical protein